jgi:hypothetical protein
MFTLSQASLLLPSHMELPWSQRRSQRASEYIILGSNYVEVEVECDRCLVLVYRQWISFRFEHIHLMNKLMDTRLWHPRSPCFPIIDYTVS